MNRILIVGDSRRMHGGVSTVIRTLESTFLWRKYRCSWLECQINSNVLVKVLYLLKAVMKSVFVMPKYDVVHFHTTPGRGLVTQMPLFLLAVVLRKRIIISFHMGNQIAGYVNDWSYKFCTRHARLVVGLGRMWQELIAKSLLDNNAGDVRTAFVYNPITLTEQVKEKGKYFLFAAFLAKNKGWDVLLDAWQEVQRQHGDYTLKVCGTGQDFQEMKERAAKVRNVEMLGWVDGEEKTRIFSHAAAYVMCSYQEGLPMSVLESLSYGTAVVTTPVGCLPEFLEEGKSALFFPFGDGKALAKAMCQVIENEPLRRTLGQNGRLLAQRHFDKNEVAKRWDEIYSSI